MFIFSLFFGIYSFLKTARCFGVALAMLSVFGVNVGLVLNVLCSFLSYFGVGLSRINVNLSRSSINFSYCFLLILGYEFSFCRQFLYE